MQMRRRGKKCFDSWRWRPDSQRSGSRVAVREGAIMRMSSLDRDPSRRTKVAPFIFRGNLNSPVSDTLCARKLLTICGVAFHHSVSYKGASGGSNECTDDRLRTYLIRVLGFWCCSASNNDSGGCDDLIDNERSRLSQHSWGRVTWRCWSTVGDATDNVFLPCSYLAIF